MQPINCKLLKNRFKQQSCYLVKFATYLAIASIVCQDVSLWQLAHVCNLARQRLTDRNGQNFEFGTLSCHKNCVYYFASWKNECQNEGPLMCSSVLSRNYSTQIVGITWNIFFVNLSIRCQRIQKSRCQDKSL